jgi:hypothetical protein
MALLYISEFSALAQGGGQQAASVPAMVTQAPIAIGASSVQSVAFSSSTRFVRLHSDVAAQVEFGVNPTAVLNVSMRLAANQTEYFGVNRGDKVAVIAPTV